MDSKRNNRRSDTERKATGGPRRHARDADIKSDNTLLDADTNAFSSTDTPLAQSNKEPSKSESSSSDRINQSCCNDVQSALKKLSHKYRMKPDMARRLRKLQNFEIVIICDDSGSMNTHVDGASKTRWNELCDIVMIMLEIAVNFDSNGVDIYFLNRKGKKNVKSCEEVRQLFFEEPAGYTPLVPVLSRVFQLPPARPNHEKKLLVLVATDGEPTDTNGFSNIRALEKVMREKRNAETTFVNFIVCTEDDEAVKYLTKFDENMKNVDVIDDFKTECAKVKENNGPNCPFTKGDYIVKALIGAIDPDIDKIGERCAPSCLGQTTPAPRYN